MCGGSTSVPGPIFPRFTHYARTCARGLPPFVSHITRKELECAFPDMFEALVVNLYLEDAGYGGPVDDEYECSPGNWYAISWGCIHYDSFYIWQAEARQLFWRFVKQCLMWIIFFGNVKSFTPTERWNIWLAFTVYFPYKYFARAADRLVRSGMLIKKRETFEDDEGVEMFYPTAKLAKRLAAVRTSSN